MVTFGQLTEILACPECNRPHFVISPLIVKLFQIICKKYPFKLCAVSLSVGSLFERGHIFIQNYLFHGVNDRLDDFNRLKSSFFPFGMLFDQLLMGEHKDHEHAGRLDRKKSLSQTRRKPSRSFRAHKYQRAEKAQSPFFWGNHKRLHEGAGNKDVQPNPAHDPHRH